MRTSFNPRSHVGSDEAQARIARMAKVSIHAPTWGATDSTCVTYPRSVVSIHAPTWGATAFSSFLLVLLLFQSTLPRGERLYIIYYSISQQVATLYLRKSFMLLLIFDYVNNKTFIYLIIS